MLMLLAGGARAQSPSLLHPLFQEHGVLQRDRPISVWGHAASGEVVTVSLGSGSAQATADAAGHWSVELPAMSAGGPFVLTAQGRSGARQSAGDILIGDVFLCSGQSNMELNVQGASDSVNEIRGAANDAIRLLNIAHATSATPLATFKDSVFWKVAAPNTVAEWSAACFFFARELQASIRIPIGLVQATWPMAFDTQPATMATMATMMQPNSALDMVQPERLLRAVSARCCGSMKFASMELTAPEMTAVS